MLKVDAELSLSILAKTTWFGEDTLRRPVFDGACCSLPGSEGRAGEPIERFRSFAPAGISSVRSFTPGMLTSGGFYQEGFCDECGRRAKYGDLISLVTADIRE